MEVPGRGNDRIVHICFHGIGVPGKGMSAADEGYFISRKFFLAVLDEVCGMPNVELSFDDGYASDVEIALSAIVERGLSARFFPVAGHIGRVGYTDTDGLRALASAGMEVGSHGMRHRSWRGMDEQVLQEELVEARRVLAAAADRAIDSAACPFGQYDRRALAALRRNGYTAVFTSDRRRASSGAWLQPRYSVRRNDTIQIIQEEIFAQPAPAQRARGAFTARLKAWR
jgi:peptidoglycan/xylan/chitin deacetylase (PgdA/CDA1 family)